MLVSQTRESKGAAVALRSSPIGSVAQSFSLSASGFVNYAQLKLFVEGTRPVAPSGFSVVVTIEGNIRVSGQDRPSGRLVDPAAMAQLDLDRIDAGEGAVYSFEFPAAFTLLKGGPYWIHLNADYPTTPPPLFRVNWAGANEASAQQRSGSMLYELFSQPGTYFNGLGANQSMYFVIGSR